MATFVGTNGTDIAIPPFVLIGFITGTLAEFTDGAGDTFSALGGDDVIVAGSGDDLIEGGAGSDNMVGNAGTDTFQYTDGSDIANDTIDGGANINTLRVSLTGTADFRTATIASSGQTSIDRLEISDVGGATVIFEGSQVGATQVSPTLAIVGSTSTDTISFQSVSGTFSLGDFSFTSWTASDRVVITATASATITGTGQNDAITGSRSADTINGGDGNDVLQGDFGNDSLDGGAGIDMNVYTFYNDPIFWNMATGAVSFFTAGGVFNGSETAVNFENVELGNGNDSITGTDGANQFITGGGNDTIIAGLGDDLIFGGLGADSASGDGGDDRFAYFFATGPTGDTIDGGARNGFFGDAIQIYFTGVADLSGVLIQSTGTTSIESLGLFGGGGHDVRFDASQFSDTGLAGNLFVQGDNASADSITINNVNGAFSAAGFSLDSWDAAVDRIVISGGTDADSLTGSNGADSLIGGGGADVLMGGDGGKDTLVGGTGADSMAGGADNDIYVVDNAGDVTTEALNEGTDLVQSSISHTLRANIENLTLTKTGNTNGTGNSLANLLIGNTGDNILDGGIGADAMRGGGGSDRYTFDNAGDTASELVGEGTDTVISSVAHTLRPNFENLTIIGTATNAFGSSVANILTGNGLNNILNGKEASDIMTGRAGLDTFVFDTALGATNVDRITDFNPVDDAIRLNDAIFSTLPLGTLAAGAFHAGTVAADGAHRIIYDQATGRVFYDADGLGGTAQVLFAILDTKPANVTSADFVVI